MPTPDFLLSVYLRGAADGLTIVAPYDDPTYQAKRSSTRILPPGSGIPIREAIPLQAATGSTPAFGMPKALRPLKRLYDQGNLLFVHATGSPDESRSHFLQQSLMERGLTSDSVPAMGTGVWARHLLTSPPVGAGSLRGMAIGGPMPKILKGAPNVAPVIDPANFSFPGALNTVDIRRAALGDMYGASGQPLRTPFGNVLQTIDEVASVDWEGYQPAPGVVYPDTPFGLSMIRAAQIAKELPGIEVVQADRGGWDTHAAQGVFGGGIMAGLLTDLGLGLEAFLRDMEAHARKVSVIVVTEFGRTLDENSAAGTDHGRGGVAIVAGDAVNGGQVITDWPGLLPGQLDGGDLAVTIDVRDLFGELLLKRLGHTDVTEVLNDQNYTYVERGITT